VTTPYDSINFPSDNTNCDFYEWAERMFLWIMSPSGESRVFDSSTFFDVSPAENGSRVYIQHEPGTFRNFSPTIIQNGPQRLPLISHPKTGKLLEIDSASSSENAKQMVANAEGEKVEVSKIELTGNKKDGFQITFFDNDGKKIEGAKPVFTEGLNTKNLVRSYTFNGRSVLVNAEGEVVDESEQGQAGGGDVLMTQNGSLVYYTLMANDVYAVYQSLYPDATDFPSTQQQLDEIVSKGKSDYGLTITDENAMSMELKLSWVEASSLSNADKYIQIQASIPTYTQTSDILWTKSGSKTTTMALVGIHIVGNVAGHPEMLWATFEHMNNTPDATYSYINTSDQSTTVNQDTSGTWTFSKTDSTGPFNESHMALSGENIQAESGFTISASDTLRTNPFGVIEGTVPNQNVTSAAESNSQIISINNNVIGMLIDGDVRQNYMQIGNTWTDSGAFPTGPYSSGGNELGASTLANTTMETYYQNNNCFFCHQPFNTPKTYTQMSHIFSELTPLTPVPSSKTEETKEKQ
jgi:sulfur carrier protein ThiS